MYDLRDEREFKAYNELLREDGHTLRIVDTQHKYVSEKVTFDRTGAELDRIPEKYYVIVTYRKKPEAPARKPEA
jgi:hypothetical protein